MDGHFGADRVYPGVEPVLADPPVTVVALATPRATDAPPASIACPLLRTDSHRVVRTRMFDNLHVVTWLFGDEIRTIDSAVSRGPGSRLFAADENASDPPLREWRHAHGGRHLRPDRAL